MSLPTPRDTQRDSGPTRLAAPLLRPGWLTTANCATAARPGLCWSDQTTGGTRDAARLRRHVVDTRHRLTRGDDTLRLQLTLGQEERGDLTVVRAAGIDPPARLPLEKPW
jgi:hypothetical protein